MSRSVLFGELPVGLLAQLDLDRTMFHHSEERPACSGSLDPGFTTTDIKHLGAALRVADTFCRHCPLLAECGRYADERKEVGVWGGKLRRYPRDGYKVTDLFGPARKFPYRRRRAA